MRKPTVVFATLHNGELMRHHQLIYEHCLSVGLRHSAVLAHLLQDADDTVVDVSYHTFTAIEKTASNRHHRNESLLNSERAVLVAAAPPSRPPPR